MQSHAYFGLALSALCGLGCADDSSGPIQPAEPETWQALEPALESIDCQLEVAPASLAWVQSLGASVVIHDLIEDHQGGAVLVGEDEQGALILELDADGSVRWAQRYVDEGMPTVAYGVDSRADGELVFVAEGQSGWVWRLSGEGEPGWGVQLEKVPEPRFVAFSGEGLAAAGGGGIARLAAEDGELFLDASREVEFRGLSEDTLGGYWYTVQQSGARHAHIEADSFGLEGTYVNFTGVSEVFAIDHDEDGELISAVRTDMDLLRVLLVRFNGDLGGEQVITYDNGVPRAMSLGPADDLLLAFEDTLSAYDTNAELLWEGSFACPEAVRLDHVELDSARRTWVSGRHGDAAFVALVEPAP